MSFRNILIVIDGTAESQHALNYYAHFFFKPQDDITIIIHRSTGHGGHHISRLLDETYGLSSGGIGVKDAFKKVIEEWAKEHHIEDFRVHPVFALSESDPGKFICTYASKHCSECILVPCHGVALQDKPLKIGKVQEYVLKNAEQPVLVIPLHLNRMIPDCLRHQMTGSCVSLASTSGSRSNSVSPNRSTFPKL